MSCADFTSSFLYMYTGCPNVSIFDVLSLSFPLLFHSPLEYLHHSFSLHNQRNQAAFGEFFLLVYTLHLYRVTSLQHTRKFSDISLTLRSTLNHVAITRVMHTNRMIMKCNRNNRIIMQCNAPKMHQQKHYANTTQHW